VIFGSELEMLRLPATYKFLAIPRPPARIVEPVDADVDTTV